MMNPDRREFVAVLAAAIGTGSWRLPVGRQERWPHPIASNVYPWMTFYQREGRSWASELDRGLGELASAGIESYEPLVSAPEEITRLAPLLRQHGLQMQSVYVASTLHDAEQARGSVANVLRIAEAALGLGTRIIVTNPAPLAGGADKTDAQLETQARELDRLGAELRGRGIVLAYHNHAPEMRNSAREYHHMLLATDPANVGLCFEAHWIYRGAGNSQVALFDVLRLYGDRVVSAHLRQSTGGVWNEVFGPGDIDYPRLARELSKLPMRPLLVLEQPVEKGTPQTLSAVEAHRRGVQYLLRLFGAL